MYSNINVNGDKTEMKGDVTAKLKLLKLNVGHPDKLTEYLDELCEISQRLSTGIQELDQILGGGLKIGGVTTIAGAPTFGKSTLALGVANNLSSQGHQVIYYTNDVGGSELVLKLLSMVSYEMLGQKGALSIDDIREYVTGARIKDDVWYKTLEGFQEKTKNIRIIDIKDILLAGDTTEDTSEEDTTKDTSKGGTTKDTSEGNTTKVTNSYTGNHLPYIQQEISTYVDQGIRPIIVLDYLQTIPSNQGGGKDKERIDYLMTQIKMLAIRFNLSVLLVSSIARLYYDQAIRMESLKIDSRN